MPPAAGRPLFACPDGTGGLFCFLPNPNLRPEVGKNKEVGINLKYDNIFTPATASAASSTCSATTSTTTSISSSPPIADPRFRRLGSFSQFYQYQNIAHARIEGVEAETLYDAGPLVCRRRRPLIRGKNVRPMSGLRPSCRARSTTTAGVRLLERRLILAAQWSSFGANNEIPVGYVPATNYDLVNLYLT